MLLLCYWFKRHRSLWKKNWKYWCICKAFNDGLNCPGVILVKDKYKIHKHTLHHMMLSVSGNCSQANLSKQFKKRQSELSQIFNYDMEKFHRTFSKK